MSCVSRSRPIQRRAHTLLSLPFGACLVFDQIQFHLDFSFPNFIPGCSDNVSVFLPPSVCSFFVWPGATCSSTQPSWLSVRWDTLLLSSEEAIFVSVLRGLIPQVSSKQILKVGKFCSPEDHGCEPAFCPIPASQDPELHHFTATAAKVAFDLHIPSESLLVGEYEIEQSASPCWLLYHLDKKVLINALQEPPE